MTKLTWMSHQVSVDRLCRLLQLLWSFLFPCDSLYSLIPSLLPLTWALPSMRPVVRMSSYLYRLCHHVSLLQEKEASYCVGLVHVLKRCSLVCSSFSGLPWVTSRETNSHWVTWPSWPPQASQILCRRTYSLKLIFNLPFRSLCGLVHCNCDPINSPALPEMLDYLVLCCPKVHVLHENWPFITRCCWVSSTALWSTCLGGRMRWLEQSLRTGCRCWWGLVSTT
jgi:hypothetical protein